MQAENKNQHSTLDNSEIKPMDQEFESSVPFDLNESSPDQVAEETEVESTSSKHMLNFLMAGVITLGLLLILCFYHFYPLNSKISGTWQATDQNEKIIFEKNKGTFIVEQYQGLPYINIEYQGRIAPKGANRYVLEKVKVFLSIKKSGLTEGELAKLKKASSVYTVQSENEKQIVLAYTPKMVKQIGTQIQLDRFYFTLEDFKYGLFPQHVRFRNESFSLNSVVFDKVKEK